MPTVGERQGYFDIETNRARFRDYAERIEAARGLVFCFPAWRLGLPAILKGFFDTVLDMLAEYYEAFGRHTRLRNQIRSLSQIAMREPVLIAADSAS